MSLDYTNTTKIEYVSPPRTKGPTKTWGESPSLLARDLDTSTVRTYIVLGKRERIWVSASTYTKYGTICTYNL